MVIVVIMSEYVMNPETGRTIRKGGRVYQRWRRAHPNSPEPLSVDPPRHRHRRRHHHRRPDVLETDLAAVLPPPSPPPLLRTSNGMRSMPRTPRRFDPVPDPLTYREDTFDPYVGNETYACRGVAPRSGLHQTPRSTDVHHYHEHDRRSESLVNPSSSGERSSWRSPSVVRDRDTRGHNRQTDDGENETRMILRLLHEHGPALLRAYQDPDEDFLQVLMDTCARVFPDV